MKRIIVTEKNESSFAVAEGEASILKSIDILLHDNSLELVIGDDGSSDYLLRIDKCKVNEEYDKDRAHTVLYGRGKGIFDQFEI